MIMHNNLLINFIMEQYFFSGHMCILLPDMVYSTRNIVYV